MKRILTLGALALSLAMALTPSAQAAMYLEPETPAQVCYPTSTVRSEDGTEIRKVYDLDPSEDPAGISRSDFDQDGFHYTLLDVLKQEAPEYEQRQYTGTVSLESKNKDMESILALLPQQKEFTTEDGLSGILTLRLDTVNVEVAGYTSATKAVTATRSYPNLSGQDTQYIPKTIEEGGKTLVLDDINWQTDNTATEDGYALGDRYTAVAVYTGSVTTRSVKGYTVTADYTGTVSRIVLNKVRYVAVFEGVCLDPQPSESPEPDNSPEPTVSPETEQQEPASSSFNWVLLLAPIGLVFVVGGVVGAALFFKKRSENEENENEEDETE